MPRKMLLVCGIAASLLYIGTDVFGALVYPGYSYTSQTISELSALGSPSRPYVFPLFLAYPPLLLAFAAGVWKVADTRNLRILAGLFGLYALLCLPFAPMHTRESLAAGGGTLTDTMHIVETILDSLLLLTIIAFGSTTFGKPFRIYSIVTLLLVVGFGLWTGSMGSAVASNLPTPWAGVTERITVFGAMLWIAVFASALLRRQPSPRTTLRAFVRRHAALTYFAIAFAISWGGILLVVGPTNILASKQVFDSFVWVPPLILGPSIAGILTTWIVGGRPAMRDYRSRLFRGRVPGRWYAAALLTAPVYYAVTALALGLLSREYLPGFITADDRAALLVQGTIVGLSAGLFEELGWTGFATPALRRRHGPLATGLIVGTLWGTWHVLPEMLGATGLGLVPYLPAQLLAVVVGLTGYRILMVWVYDRTQSLLIGILMHAALTASLLIVQPLVVGLPLVWVGIVLDAVPWVIVAAVALIHLQRRSRPKPTPPWSASATPRPAH